MKIAYQSEEARKIRRRMTAENHKHVAKSESKWQSGALRRRRHRRWRHGRGWRMAATRRCGAASWRRNRRQTQSGHQSAAEKRGGGAGGITAAHRARGSGWLACEIKHLGYRLKHLALSAFKETYHTCWRTSA
jgi:hypothetical protein